MRIYAQLLLIHELILLTYNPKAFSQITIPDFDFVKGTGIFLLNYYKKVILEGSSKAWTKQQRKKLLLKRGRYVEFNLLYDKGTTFGLKTGGNTDAILMSMPPKVLWN